MEWTAVALLVTLIHYGSCNQPPVFDADMNNEPLAESTPVGQVVYKLEGHDPEGSPVYYGIQGTDRFSVDRTQGEVRIVKPLDREVNDTLRFQVTLEDEVEGGTNNLVEVPISIIILDDNDNAPVFKETPYEFVVPENAAVGTTVFSNIKVEDADLVGEILDVVCENSLQAEKVCSKFGLVTINATERLFLGGLVLKEPLNYADQQFYVLGLTAYDGMHNTSASIEITVGDVQDTPPVFVGSLTGVVREDAPIGTLVMTVQARDGDKGQPRPVVYDLIMNPMDYFLIDTTSGELRTARPLDREALDKSNGVVSLTIRVREVVDGIPSNDESTVATAIATITIKDVNDEPPRFNKRDYSVIIKENIPTGTPLPHLDMIVTDPDVGSNAQFSLRLEDVSKAFSVEPTAANGSTSVSIRVTNGSLDYENPNQRKFIILVIAEETNTTKHLSSTATLTVEVSDANDNAPTFDRDAYAVTVSETATPGTIISTITAMDRDSGEFGRDGLVYQLQGDKAERFSVDPETGTITVALCNTPGTDPCLDYETQSVYFLTYKATDTSGEGLSTSVPLKISLLDSNDNPPEFESNHYSALIDEGKTEFDPPLIVQARDKDKTSEIRYSIESSNAEGLVDINPLTGEITVISPEGLDMSAIDGETLSLVAGASDDMFKVLTTVNITVLDVNNNAPEFEYDNITINVKEDTPVGASLMTVSAYDADTGINAVVNYRIEKGAFSDFAVEPLSGDLSIASKLDYDRRMDYTIEIIAYDGGTPSLTGTTTVNINIENTNDKNPYFSPALQRIDVAEDAAVGKVFYRLVAKDPDVNQSDALNFAVAEPITAVDKNGVEVDYDTSYKTFFSVDKLTGDVSVANPLQRDMAAVVRLTVIVTDTTAPNLQQGNGTLIVSIMDVNDFAPQFPPPWTRENPKYSFSIWEEQPIGTVLGTFTAFDEDSIIDHYAIVPESEYFEVNNETGAIKSKSRIDFEKVETIHFNLFAYDSGLPQMSSSALFIVHVNNTNDNSPVFNQSEYHASIMENSPRGTYLTTVQATDDDKGILGKVSYRLTGSDGLASIDFNVDDMGSIFVANPESLDRELNAEITIQVIAYDGGLGDNMRSASAPLHIKVIDVNDNKPVFSQHHYTASIVENIPLSPAAPIVQLKAEDKDNNAQLMFKIVSGNSDDVFRIDPETGIIYPQASLQGKLSQYVLAVEVSDSKFSDTAKVDIAVLDVNQAQPLFKEPPLPNATVLVPENTGPDHLIMKVHAIDTDSGENGRVTYHFKINNLNVQETEEFMINADTGELKSKILLDREEKSSYQLVLVARDQGSPTWYESLRFLTIVLEDVDDNKPTFMKENASASFLFQVRENNPLHLRIGKLEAFDKDEGVNAKVYYYIIEGNADRSFAVDRLDGSVYTNSSLDRETRSTYDLYVKATNDPDYYPAKESNVSLEDPSVARVRILVLDENDNPPIFNQTEYNTGVNSMADLGTLVCQVDASDLDEGANGSLTYQITASYLYRAGSNVSSGSVVPSPFMINSSGRITIAAFVAEYNQEWFKLNVVAKESAPPFREAVAIVNVWIYEQKQLIRVILSRPPKEVHQDKEEIVMELSNVTNHLVVVDEIKYHLQNNGSIRYDWSDLYMHVIDRKTQNIAQITDILEMIDTQYDLLKDYYASFAIENVIPAYIISNVEPFEPALAALVALLIVLCVGTISIIIVCCCFRHWVVTDPSDVKSDMLIKKTIIDDLNTTENPLWIEQKLKLYEEQELTMQVFCEPDRIRRDSVGDLSVGGDNTYATIQRPHSQQRDYATLGGSILPLDSASTHSQQMYEAALGFQGSTFQVPDSPPDTADLLRARSELRVNKDGQPEFVSELI
ncbi:cadherin-87A isoform X2 [Bemisia tabaci]|uniref:cadherin-87A isoform X2 n=1 Tax=Bemisia tabaci TaxID=7038 RepID=UPI0008F9D4AD|nr:PREDICTED: cadherin-87A isoform X2 [Bemisia tabaci]